MPNAKTNFTFVLQPEFPLTALILACDALRIANQNSGQDLFGWQVLSEDARDVRASNGMWFTADADLAISEPVDVCLLFQGNLPTQNLSRKLLGYLRTMARFGAIVGGVDTGAYALAQAGLAATEALPDVVLHWEAGPTFLEWFPDAKLHNNIYMIAENRAHCAGGMATLDLILDLIAQFSGESMATEVANAMVHSRRGAGTQQRRDQNPDGEQQKLTSRLIKTMEQNLDFPLSLDELAELLETPKRSLARVSETAFGISPMRLYLQIRLQAARNFLFYEDHSIKEIATACGFSAPTAFSRCFKVQYDQTPSEFRVSIRKSQRLTEHPEIHRIIGHRTGAMLENG